MKTAIIILAAGSSSRLGKPKQLIEIQGINLLDRAINAAQNSQSDGMVVVLGWNPELIKTGFDSVRIPFVVNSNWEVGMSSSMQSGLRFLIQKENPDQVILMLCDQPFVEDQLLNQLISEKERSGRGIVACAYSNTLGVPAIFDKKYFEDLLTLKGTDGAKKVIFKNKADVLELDFPLGAVDLDTEADLDRLRGLSS